VRLGPVIAYGGIRAALIMNRPGSSGGRHPAPTGKPGEIRTRVPALLVLR